MDNSTLTRRFSDLSTPLIADACLRLNLSLRLAPTGIRPLLSDSHLMGRVLPAKHFGSVDVFLEAMLNAEQGDVLVIDNQGRTDEGCIGDLTVLEARASGLAGIIVWGTHRDSEELIKIRFQVFSYGACPAGPQRLDAREDNALQQIHFGDQAVTRDDIVFADEDGVLFVSSKDIDEVIATAHSIWETERKQADLIRSGKTLREQLHFQEYLSNRAGDPAYTFRQHLRTIGGAIEE